MANGKINWTTIAGIGGVALSLCATLLGNYSSTKQQEKTIEKKVAEALLKKGGES